MNKSEEQRENNKAAKNILGVFVVPAGIASIVVLSQIFTQQYDDIVPNMIMTVLLWIPVWISTKIKP